MRKFALGFGVAASAIAAPAVARNGETYVGADVGVVFANEYDAEVDGRENAVTTESDPGWEFAGLLGHDFGPIRAELEGSYKEFNPEQYTSAIAGLPRGSGVPVTGTMTGFGEHRFTSVMLNALLDFGGEDGIGFSVGGGAGHTWSGFDLNTTETARYIDDEAHDWAWQALAQLRAQQRRSRLPCRSRCQPGCCTRDRTPSPYRRTWAGAPPPTPTLTCA